MGGTSKDGAAEEPGVAEPMETKAIMIEELGDFMQKLKQNRLIKIFIGEDAEQEPYLVSENVLRDSSEYFRKALDNEQRMGNDPGVLRFPEDGDALPAWGLMLYWITNRRLPLDKIQREHLVLYAQSWALADKHLMPKLQDAVMMALIIHFEKQELKSDSGLVNKLLRLSPVDTPLRRLLAEETVYNMYCRCNIAQSRLLSSDLIGSDGVTGLSGSLLDALEVLLNNYRRPFRRLMDYDGDGFEEFSYKEYLVSEGAEQAEWDMSWGARPWTGDPWSGDS